MRILRLLLICVVGFFVYAALDTSNDREHIAELRKKDPSLLTDQDKLDLTAAVKEEKEAEKRRIAHEKEERAEREKNQAQTQALETQLNTRIACEDIARGKLRFPDSYQDESHEDGVSKIDGKDQYYFTLHYSGVNAFNVRSTSTIECYSPLNSRGEKVTYRSFDQ